MSKNNKRPIIFSQKVKKHAGGYIAVAKNQVVASGKSAKETFELAKKILGAKNKIEGIYYVPTKKDLLTALLCVFHITK